MKQEEKLEEAKRLYKTANADQRYVLESLFPELKESEDESMVKFIKNQLFNIKKTITENYELDAKLTMAIEWLEKQAPKPKWSENDEEELEIAIEIPFGAKDSELQEVTYFIPKGFHAEIDDDKVVIKKGEKSAEWSEEDEIRLDRICKTLWKNRKGDTDEIFQQEQDVDWLKSLKQRNF